MPKRFRERLNERTFAVLVDRSMLPTVGKASISTHRVAFLSNSWLEGDRWGPFQRSMIDLFREAVDDLLVVRANSFFSPWTDSPYSELHLRRFLQVLGEYQPTMVFTTNRAGMAAPVIDRLPKTTRVITLFIDYYDRVPEELKRWTERDFVWGTGTGWIRDNFVRKYRNILAPDQIEFTLWGSDSRRFVPQELNRDLDVLFVGSPLSIEPFADVVQFLARNHPERLEIFLDVYREHRQRYIYDIPNELELRGFNRSGISKFPYRAYLDNNWILQSFMSDQISSEVRFKYLSALSDFDLHLYGEPEGLWIQLMSTVNANLLQRYYYRPVEDAEELAELYSRAKVGLNVQHHHALDVGLSMRVFDIMASGAVLLTHRTAALPLSELGYREDEHYVAFDGVSECRSKARSLLDDLTARERVASNGMALTHEAHTLQHRLSHVMQKAGHPDLAVRFDELIDARVRRDQAPVTYVSDPDQISVAPATRPPFPRTVRDARVAIGRKLPSPLVNIDLRLFGSWSLRVLLKHDPERRAKDPEKDS